MVLLVGYLVYSRFTEKIFGADNRPTPAIAHPDGVDRVPIKTWKAFLIQLLNIAGTGPIFGALMGAVFGPVVFLWIVLGSVFAGAVHDYVSGMISIRHNGESIAELAGIYCGKPLKWFMRLYSVPMLILVGAVFITSPAVLLAMLTPEKLNVGFWAVVIFIYYLLATLLPIDKVIGKIYPVFGVILIVMALGIFVGICFSGEYHIPEITFADLHPDNLPIWPFMFITVACGAISGFHATQSPMIAKCITGEHLGRSIFYGAMIIESVIALVWAAAGVAFYGATDALGDALVRMGQSGVVYDISCTLLGPLGGILAVIGVVVCPITSGDTACRSARLILSECTGLDQSSIKNRLIITIPVLAVCGILTQIDFNILWRYFAWGNQTLAMITLWVATAYFIRKGKGKFSSLITAVPAAFMTGVCVTYILIAKEGFALGASVSYPAGILLAAASFVFYLFKLSAVYRKKGNF